MRLILTAFVINLILLCSVRAQDSSSNLFEIGSGFSSSSISISTPTGESPIFEVGVGTLSAVRVFGKIEIEEMEVKAKGIRSLGRGKFKGADLEIEDSDRGLILTSSGTIKWLIWVDDNGGLFTTQISASPEISIEDRRIKLSLDRASKKDIRRRHRSASSLLERLLIVEEFLGIE